MLDAGDLEQGKNVVDSKRISSRKNVKAADIAAYEPMFREALKKIETMVMSLDLSIFFTTAPSEPSDRAKDFNVRNEALPMVAKITEVCILFLAFMYRSPEKEGYKKLYDLIVKDVYGFNEPQLEEIHRVARKFSLLQTIYQSSVFNQALGAFLMEHYWNPDVYPTQELPPAKERIRDAIARYLGDIPTLEDDELGEVMRRYESSEATANEDGYSLPEISGEEQSEVATQLSDKIEQVSTFITKLRDLYAPQPEMEDVDTYLDTIIIDDDT